MLEEGDLSREPKKGTNDVGIGGSGEKRGTRGTREIEGRDCHGRRVEPRTKGQNLFYLVGRGRGENIYNTDSALRATSFVRCELGETRQRPELGRIAGFSKFYIYFCEEGDRGRWMGRRTADEALSWKWSWAPSGVGRVQLLIFSRLPGLLFPVGSRLELSHFFNDIYWS